MPCPAGELRGDDGACGREATVRLRTPDGARLFTWVVLPDDVPAGGVPALVSRTPYNASFDGARDADREAGRFHAARGYAFVSQDARGRPESTGDLWPEQHEVADARVTVEWIAAQAWSNGAVGAIGGSYLGYTALAAAVDNPAVKVVIADDPSLDETTARPGGTFWTSTVTWLRLVESGQDTGAEEMARLSSSFDIAAADDLLLGHDSACWNAVAAHDDIAYWPAESLALLGARRAPRPAMRPRATRARSRRRRSRPSRAVRPAGTVPEMRSAAPTGRRACRA
jgi:predicted acyl esterase